jgi:hypothetical protein
MTNATQKRTGRCERGHVTAITATASPYEFNWTCPPCPTAGTISWAHVHPPPLFKGVSAMRLFDTDRVGCYLDAVGLRLEKTKDAEHKVIDLTLRVQPFTPELAQSLHPDVRTLLFTLGNATPKPLLKAVELKLPGPLPKQHLDCYLLPEELDGAAFALLDAEISDPRVRTEKGVDGYALVFYATIGPVGRDELEFVTAWYTQQRFVTFREAQATMDFAGKTEGETEAPKPRRGRKATPPAETETSDDATV